MSRVNGDKSRFNRERKQKIARRIRNRKLFESGKHPAVNPATKPAPVSA
jgi:hypothetical protein